MEQKAIENIKIENILPNRLQPRVIFQDEAIDELAESIKKHGIINPITVRRLGEKYEIIAGERRFKASQLVGKEEIPAIVIEADDKKTAELALIENIQRKELSPIEEGMSYEKILQIGDITQADLSKQLGKKQSTIANKIRLLKLDDEVKEALLNEKISERHARALLKLENKNDQKEMLARIMNERLTVRQTDQEIEKLINNKGEIIEMNKNLPESNLIFDKENEEIKLPGVNPSFVDVEKIEQTSEDLFKEKPIVNIEDLLKSTQVEETPEPEQEETEQEEVVPEMPKPKFFNMFPQDEEEQTTNQENQNLTENFEVKQEEMPDFLLKTEENTEPEMSFNINDIKSFEQEELPEIKVDKIEEPKVELAKEDKKEPELDFSNFNPIIYNDFAGEEINEEEVEFFEEEPEEEIQEPQTPKQMKDVIRIIRDCNSIIESYGYRIETEEFDLDTMYQVIFKIYK